MRIFELEIQSLFWVFVSQRWKYQGLLYSVLVATKCYQACYVPYLGGKAVTLLNEPIHRDHTEVSKQKGLFRTKNNSRTRHSGTMSGAKEK